MKDQFWMSVWVANLIVCPIAFFTGAETMAWWEKAGVITGFIVSVIGIADFLVSLKRNYKEAQ